MSRSKECMGSSMVDLTEINHSTREHVSPALRPPTLDERSTGTSVVASIVPAMWHCSHSGGRIPNQPQHPIVDGHVASHFLIERNCRLPRHQTLNVFCISGRQTKWCNFLGHLAVQESGWWRPQRRLLQRRVPVAEPERCRHLTTQRICPDAQGTLRTLKLGCGIDPQRNGPMAQSEELLARPSNPGGGPKLVACPGNPTNRTGETRSWHTPSCDNHVGNNGRKRSTPGLRDVWKPSPNRLMKQNCVVGGSVSTQPASRPPVPATFETSASRSDTAKCGGLVLHDASSQPPSGTVPNVLHPRGIRECRLAMPPEPT